MNYPYFIAHNPVAEGLTFHYEQRVGAWTYDPVEYGGPQCIVNWIFEQIWISDVYMIGLLVSSWTVFDRLGHPEWFIVFDELCLSESTMSAGWKCFNGPSNYNPMLRGISTLFRIQKQPPYSWKLDCKNWVFSWILMQIVIFGYDCYLLRHNHMHVYQAWAPGDQW